MIRLVSLAGMVLALLVPAAFAQDLPRPRPVRVDCHANDLHYVIGVPAVGGGTSYRVGNFTSIDQVMPCTAEAPYTREFSPSNGSALKFEAIADDLLVLTESTGPEFFLQIYDLALPEPILRVDAHDVEPSELGIHYYEASEPATPATCSRYADLTAGGMSAVVAVERFFRFDRAEVEPGKGSRCYQTP